jgi:hypothetical protein
LDARHCLFSNAVANVQDGGLALTGTAIALEQTAFVKCVQRAAEGAAALSLSDFRSHNFLKRCLFLSCSPGKGCVALFNGTGNVAVQACHFDESRERAIQVRSGASLAELQSTFGGLRSVGLTFEDIGWRGSRSPTYAPSDGTSEETERDDGAHRGLPGAIRVLLAFAGFSITIVGESAAARLVRRFRRDGKAARELL